MAEWGKASVTINGRFFDWRRSEEVLSRRPGPGPFDPPCFELTRPLEALLDRLRLRIAGFPELRPHHLRGTLAGCRVAAGDVLDLRRSDIEVGPGALWRATLRQAAAASRGGVLTCSDGTEALVLFDRPESPAGVHGARVLSPRRGTGARGTEPAVGPKPAPKGPPLQGRKKLGKELAKRLRCAEQAFHGLLGEGHPAWAEVRRDLLILRREADRALRDPELGPAYAEFLTKLIPALYIEHAYAALKSPDWALRLASAATIGERRRRVQITPLLEASQSDDWFERQAAATALADLADARARDAFDKLLVDNDAQVRRQAVAMGARSRPEERRRSVQHGLADHAAEVRLAAVLGAARTPPLRELPLLEVLAHSDPDPEVREHATLAILARPNTPPPSELVWAALTSGDQTRVARALTAIGTHALTEFQAEVWKLACTEGKPRSELIFACTHVGEAAEAAACLQTRPPQGLAGIALAVLRRSGSVEHLEPVVAASREKKLRAPSRRVMRAIAGRSPGDFVAAISQLELPRDQVLKLLRVSAGGQEAPYVDAILDAASQGLLSVPEGASILRQIPHRHAEPALARAVRSQSAAARDAATLALTKKQRKRLKI